MCRFLKPDNLKQTETVMRTVGTFYTHSVVFWVVGTGRLENGQKRLGDEVCINLQFIKISKQ
jgi:hypothetical protein